MRPENRSTSQPPYATSPWTEMYQTSNQDSMLSQTDQSALPPYDWRDDTQQPTHDALSDTYNA
jgi:hypothetical protein